MYLKIALGATIGLIGTGSLLFVFVFPPVGIALLALGTVIGLGGIFAQMAFATARDEKAEGHYQENISLLKKLEGYKKHYTEPKFKEFLKQFPTYEKGKHPLDDPKLFKVVHSLYDKEQKFAKELAVESAKHPSLKPGVLYSQHNLHTPLNKWFFDINKARSDLGLPSLPNIPGLMFDDSNV